MKMRVMSDLHVEFGGVELDDSIDCDVVVLAGDIDVLKLYSVPAWAQMTFPTRDMVWVLGNHEYYDWRKDSGMEACLAYAHSEAKRYGVYLLENRAVELAGVRFLGCTLWTDFELLGNASVSKHIAAGGMNDFQVIYRERAPGGWKKDGQRLRPFTPAEAVAIHRESVAWLDQELGRPFDGKTVVVTHHTPHADCNHPAFRGDILSPAYCSDLTWLIEKHAPDIWISGHTHASYRFHIGKTLLISNQRGYSNEPEWPEAPFNPSLVIEV